MAVEERVHERVYIYKRPGDDCLEEMFSASYSAPRRWVSGHYARSIVNAARALLGMGAMSRRMVREVIDRCMRDDDGKRSEVEELFDDNSVFCVTIRIEGTRVACVTSVETERIGGDRSMDVGDHFAALMGDALRRYGIL